MPQARKSPAGLPPTLTVEQLVYLLDLSGSRVSQLVTDQIVQRTATGRYSIGSVPSFIKYLRAHGSGPVALSQARRDLAVERAALARLERQEREGALIPTNQVREVYARSFGAVRSRVLQLPSKLAVRLAAAESAVQAQQIIRDECEELLSDAVHGVVEFRGSKGPSRRGRPSKAVVDVEAAEQVTAAE
jgi:hypothetical protein